MTFPGVSTTVSAEKWDVPTGKGKRGSVIIGQLDRMLPINCSPQFGATDPDRKKQPGLGAVSVLAICTALSAVPYTYR